MNRTESLAALKTVNISRTDVHGKAIGNNKGFFLADAISVLNGFERASRTLSALTKNGKVNCTTVIFGGTTHDFYTVIGG